MAAPAGLQLIPGQTTLGAIRLSAQRRSNQLNNRGISPDQWTDFVLDSLFEMHGLIVSSFGDNYRVSLPAYQFVTDGVTDNYPMPGLFYKALLVEWLQSPPGSVQNVTLRRMNFTEKNRYSTAFATPTYAGFVPEYTDVADTLLLVPRAALGMVINVWYIPRNRVPYEAGLVSLGSSPTSTEVVAGDVVTINGLAFLCVASGATGRQFNVGATDTDTATNLVAAINASALSRLLTASNLITATQTTNDVTLTLNNLLTPAKLGFSNAAGTVRFVNCFTGQTVTVNGQIFTCVQTPPAKDEYQLGATDALTATSFANAFNASGLNGAFTASASTTTVTFTNAQNLPLFTNPCQSVSFSPGCEWTNLVDGVNGWERDVVVDVCLKVLNKYGRDSSAFQLEHDAMVRRIQNETKNRDAGSPKTMIDVRYGGRGGGYG